MSQPKGRIEPLDGMRALAILLVMAFHYGARWTPPRSPVNLYPYGDALTGSAVIDHGYLGVELFFIVSGFVIALTLSGCADWREFALKRCARLVPSMWLCALITFSVLHLLPGAPFHPAVADFLPSLSFIDPSLFTRVLHRPFGGIDGVYWSLFVEVKFYFWAAVLYFSGDRRGFLGRALAVFIAVALLDFAVEKAGWASARSFLELVAFPQYLPWFAAGIGFHALSRERAQRLAQGLVAGAALVLVGRWLILEQPDATSVGLTMAFFGLFGLFVYRPKLLTPLAFRPLVSIGAASYSLYLLHQSLGVALIGWLATVLGWWGATESIVLAPLVGAGFVFAAIGIFRFWEIPAKSWILSLARLRPISAARGT